MTLALIVTIVLSVIFIVGALTIWKSSFSYNDKIVTVMGLLAVFCLIPIINEARKSNYDETKLGENEFERHFFTALDRSSSLNLPILEDHANIITNSLGGWNAEDPDSYQFALVYSNQKVGKTLSFKEYTNHLQRVGIPSLYIPLKTVNIDILQFADALKISTLGTLEEVIDRFNSYGKVPNIFVDDIENAFAQDGFSDYSFPCSVCEYMKSLYDTKKVNIVFITNKPIIKDILESNEAYNKRMGFYEFQERDNSSLATYLTEKINGRIGVDGKKFDSKTVNLLNQELGWDFNILSQYVENIAAYKDVNDFIKSVVDEEARRISGHPGLEHLLKSMANLNPGKTLEWIPYASIRQHFGENPSKKLEEAVRANILVKSHNLYKFSSPITHNAVLRAFETGNFDL